MCRLQTGSGTVTYIAVRRAMDGEPYTMSLTGRDEIRAVTEAVNWLAELCFNNTSVSEGSKY